MKHRFLTALLLWTAACSTPAPREAAPAEPAREPAAAIEPASKRIEDLIAKMTIDEKLDLLGGTGFGTKGLARLGIQRIEMTDGPQGIRGPRATAFPSTLATIATWNPPLMREVSAAIGREVRAIGKNMILGPCVTLYRVPQGGRNFECSGEDPYLNAEFAKAYVWGTQDSKVLSSTKHFLLNNQESNRNWMDMSIDERSLHELELPAFEAAIAAGTESVMASYNLVDTLHASENHKLLTGLLKGQLGYKGLVVSDWESTYNGWMAAMAGLDLEMPTGEHLNVRLKDRVRNGSLPIALINDKIRRQLRALEKVGGLDAPVRRNPADINTPENRKVALRAAEEAMVLLKNDGGLLPLQPSKIKTIALVGPGAATRRIHGNGSGEVSSVFSYTSVLQGLRAALPANVKIKHAAGVRPEQQTELLEIFRPELDGGTLNGFRAEYFDNDDLRGKPLLVRQEPDLHVWNTTTPDPRLKIDNYTGRWTAKLVLKRAGPVKFDVFSGRGYRLFVDGKLVGKDLLHDNDEWQSTPTTEPLAAGTHDLRVEFRHTADTFKFSLHWYPPPPNLEEAVEAARTADVVVAVVGTSNSFEMEAADRKEILMPGGQDEFLQKIIAANPRTVVVVNSGGIVSMRAWRDRAPAILQAWLAGQEGGNAVARTLLGLNNPSGKLPVTIPRDLQDSPSAEYYWGQIDFINYGRVGVMDGYRGYDQAKKDVEFPFGHGLSYSNFVYGKPRVQVVDDRAASPRVRVTVPVQNAGRVAGAEVVQLYVHQGKPKLPRPPRELKGFSKVGLAAGETKDVVFELDAAAFRYWNPDKKNWVTDADTFAVQVGSSSRDIRGEDSLKLRP